MKTIVNKTDETVESYFNGQTIVFGSGQKRAFSDGVAAEIARETKGLEIEEEEVVQEGKIVEPKVSEKKEEVIVANETPKKKK